MSVGVDATVKSTRASYVIPSHVTTLLATDASSVLTASAANHNKVSKKLIESLDAYVAKVKSKNKFLQLRTGCNCINREILQDMVDKRNEISSTSYLMNIFPNCSSAQAEERFNIIKQSL